MLNNESDTVTQLTDRFWDWMETIPWLEPSEHLLATLLEPPSQIDLAAEVIVPGGGVAVLIVQMKETLRPADVSALANQLRSYSGGSGFSDDLRKNTGIQASDARIVPIAAAKWLSPRTQEELRKAGLGWFDLAGNAHIEFPGAYIHIEGIDNPFKEENRGISWNSEPAQRVFRVLLDSAHQGQHWRQREIEEACRPKVSLGTVNKVVKKLVEEAYAEETDEGLILRDPGGLLKRWAQNYSPLRQQVRKCYTSLHGDNLIDRIRDFCANRGNRFAATETDFALAGLSAAKFYAPYVRDSTLYCYGSPMAAEQFIERLELQESPEGANVLVWVTKYPDPFLKAERVADKLYATNPLQTYLDLSAGGERSQEAAEFLYDQKLRELWEGGNS